MPEPIHETPFDFPSWFTGGVHERTLALGALQDVPLLREVVSIVLESHWPALVVAQDALNLRPYVPHTFRQTYNSCASESLAGALQTCRGHTGEPFILLNPLSLYHFVCGGRDAGSYLTDNIAWARKHGIAPESVWPYSKGWSARPSEAAMEAALAHRVGEAYDLDYTSTSQFRLEVGSALLQGLTVYCGYSGHAIYLTRLVQASPAMAEYHNSWGTAWGDKGFGVIALSNLQRSYGAFALRTPWTVQPA